MFVVSVQLNLSSILYVYYPVPAMLYEPLISKACRTVESESMKVSNLVNVVVGNFQLGLRLSVLEGMYRDRVIVH